jgi:hypothetical protein
LPTGGVVNSGSGGGGNGSDSGVVATGKDGAAGIVIIRYAVA